MGLDKQERIKHHQTHRVFPEQKREKAGKGTDLF